MSTPPPYGQPGYPGAGYGQPAYGTGVAPKSKTTAALLAFFLGGLDKGPFLRGFEPDFFFDDQTGHCESAHSAEAPTGHVISGIRNADSARADQ